MYSTISCWFSATSAAEYLTGIERYPRLPIYWFKSLMMASYMGRAISVSDIIDYFVAEEECESVGKI